MRPRDAGDAAIGADLSRDGRRPNGFADIPRKR